METQAIFTYRPCESIKNIPIFPLALQLYSKGSPPPACAAAPWSRRCCARRRPPWLWWGGGVQWRTGGGRAAGGCSRAGQRRKWVSWYLGWGPHTQTLQAEQGGRDQYFQAETLLQESPRTDDFANNNRYIYCSSANPNTVEDLSYYPLTQHPGLPLPGCEGLETAILQVVVSGLLVGTIAPFVNNLYSATWSFLNFLCTNFVLLLHVTGKLRQLNYIFSFISRSH